MRLPGKGNGRRLRGRSCGCRGVRRGRRWLYRGRPGRVGRDRRDSWCGSSKVSLRRSAQRRQTSLDNMLGSSAYGSTLRIVTRQDWVSQTPQRSHVVIDFDVFVFVEQGELAALEVFAGPGLFAVETSLGTGDGALARPEGWFAVLVALGQEEAAGADLAHHGVVQT